MSLDSKDICFIIEQMVVFLAQTYRAMLSYKDRQDTDKKIKDVRKQYHRNDNCIYCGLMTIGANHMLVD